MSLAEDFMANSNASAGIAQLIMTLRLRGVRDQRVLAAMEFADRALFVKGHFAERAYEDCALPIASGQTICLPSIVALITPALYVQSPHRVVEMGTVSVYQAVILSRLCRVFGTIEGYRNLAREAEALFERFGLRNVVQIKGDGSHGLPQVGPFDRIMVTAAAEDPPGPLLAQLKVGGIMVLPVGSEGSQILIRVTRLETGYDYEELMPVRFVPLLEGTAGD
jgi:protein-L-isoaspartate(D-aspartate) O-methyltransferase